MRNVNLDLNRETDSNKAAAKKIIDKFSALTSRIDVNIEISRIISSIDRKSPSFLFKLTVLDM